jgi:transcriptional regulator with PAS, ATPase and Fis domain
MIYNSDRSLRKSAGMSAAPRSVQADSSVAPAGGVAQINTSSSDDTRELNCVSGHLVGESASMAAIKSLAMTIASRHSTILINGETGTGKEMLARFIHSQSNRSDRPFIPVDCSALTDTLIESQLFGHVRGAFTGAVRDSLGFIRAAHGGTLFLDEIGELPLHMQAKLLRVIQERAVVPVGGHQAYGVDIRIISATHRYLSDRVKCQTFREDLYYRLNVIGLTVPPLRERSSDILTLCHHFLDRQAAVYHEPVRVLSDTASSILQAYHWPGNVRELANVMEHAHVLASDNLIQPSNLPAHLLVPLQTQLQVPMQVPRQVSVELSNQSDTDSGNRLCQTLAMGSVMHSDRIVEADSLNIEHVERQTIIEALRRCQGNRTAAARMLGMNIQKLGRRITRLSITPSLIEPKPATPLTSNTISSV